tara:strand:+ start:320 stop:550 length:231 start_codon:yes stop_codon:yes gene_type:complete
MRWGFGVFGHAADDHNEHDDHSAANHDEHDDDSADDHDVAASHDDHDVAAHHNHRTRKIGDKRRQQDSSPDEHRLG